VEGSGFRNISNYRKGLMREELLGTATTLPKANGEHGMLQPQGSVYTENRESGKWNKLSRTGAPLAATKPHIWQHYPHQDSVLAFLQGSVSLGHQQASPVLWTGQPREAGRGGTAAAGQSIAAQHTHVRAA